MSDSGASIPKDLADSPSNPFQPTLPSSRSLRRPIVRRPAAQPLTTGSLPTRTSKPFGEIGKEDENDDFDFLSLISSTAEDVDDEDVPFMPRVRDLRYRRPIVRKETLDVKKTEQEGEVKEGKGKGEEKPVVKASGMTITKDDGEGEKKKASAEPEEEATLTPAEPNAVELSLSPGAPDEHDTQPQQQRQKEDRT